jgi:hypothetical protein
VKKFHSQLFADELIDPWDLVDLIVEHTCPSLESTKGIASVLGKTELAPSLDIAFPFKLTEKDRETLANLLPTLPELHGDMSESEIAEFLDSYRQLVGRPPWEPSVVTDLSRRHRKEEQAHLREEHRVALRLAVTSGEVRVVQENYLPAKNISIGAFIPNADARKYLTHCGISINFTSPPPENLGAAADLPPYAPISSPQESLRQDDEINLAAIPAREIKPNTGTAKRWTDEKLEELKAYRSKHGTKKTAEYFGISDGLVRQKDPIKEKNKNANGYWGGLTKR